MSSLRRCEEEEARIRRALFARVRYNALPAAAVPRMSELFSRTRIVTEEIVMAGMIANDGGGGIVGRAP